MTGRPACTTMVGLASTMTKFTADHIFTGTWMNLDKDTRTFVDTTKLRWFWECEHVVRLCGCRTRHYLQHDLWQKKRLLTYHATQKYMTGCRLLVVSTHLRNIRVPGSELSPQSMCHQSLWEKVSSLHSFACFLDIERVFSCCTDRRPWGQPLPRLVDGSA